MKSTVEVKVSGILETKTNLQNAKIPEHVNEDISVCKQNDKDCWHRYSSAMGDCV